MKNLLTLGAVIVGLFTISGANAQCGNGGCGAPAQACAQPCAPSEQPTGDCWCKFVRYNPSYYSVPRCVEERIPCTKKACRMITKTYDVKKCRMVPEYFTETYCYQEPEYYDVPDCKIVQRTVYDQKVKMIPEYFWKQTCNNPCAAAQPAPAPACSPCGR